MKNKLEYSFVGPQRPRRELWGHDLGKQRRAEIETVLETLPPGGTLVLQLKGVKVMDFSFAGEVFGKLIGALPTAYPGRALVLANPSEYVQINLHKALESLGLMAFTTSGARWDVIGKAAETDRQTLEVLAKRKQATAPEIANALTIQLTTCNQRLRKLVESGVILRAKVTASTGGEQYIYSWPV